MCVLAFLRISAMIELHLPDMTCGHCVRTVTEVARRLDPQAQVQTDLATHTARLRPKPANRPCDRR